MHETPDDLRALQALLDQSAAAGGRHLADVITPDRRLQLLLVAFCFGALIEGIAGFGARQA